MRVKAAGTTYGTLNAMRGVAAILVVIYHLGQATVPTLGGAYLAVDFFFMLSGFVLMRAYGARLRGTLGLGRFAVMRLVRLWPLYALGTGMGLTIGVASALLHVHGAHSLSALAAIALPNILFLPAPFARLPLFPLDPPCWSLLFELAISFVFAGVLVRLNDRSLASLTLGASAALALMSGSPDFLNVGWRWGWMHLAGGALRTLATFPLGMLIARAGPPLARRVTPLAILPPALLALPMLATLPLAVRAWGEPLMLLTLFPALVVAGAVLEPVPAMRRGYALLGDLSFPIYVVHAPLVALWVRATAGAHLRFAVSATGFVAVSLAVAWLAARIDAAARRALSNRLGLREQAPPSLIGRARRLSKSKAVALVVALAFRPLALLAPRSTRHWAFGHSGETFAGNPRFLFLWMELHRPDLHVTWVTRSTETLAMLRAGGHRAVHRWSPRGIVAALRARTFVFSHDPGDVNLALAPGAIRLDLWHGVGLKALHTGHRSHRGLRQWLNGFIHLPHDIVATTSPLMQAHFAAQFALPQDRCPQLGYPRLDGTHDARLRAASAAVDRALGFDFEAIGAAETYIYMPTYRDTGRPFFDEALPDLPRLDAILRTRNAILYVKPHPRTPPPALDGVDNIRLWPDPIDVATYLHRLTGLITDYSSILYDYLRERDDGCVLYLFDQARYVRERPLAHDFDEHVAGKRANGFADLCRLLETGEARATLDRHAVARVRRLFWEGSPDPASAAIVRYVEHRFGETSALARHEVVTP